MWPFPKKNLGLIDAQYLVNNGIDSSYQKAFNWTKKELKTEIKRNEMNIAEVRKAISELDTKFHSNNMIKSELNDELERLRKDDDIYKDGQLYKKINGERTIIATQNEKITTDKINQMSFLENFTKSNAMLNSILSGLTKTPEQLTRKPIKYEYVEDPLEGLPSEEEMLGDTAADMERRREKFGKDEE